MFYHFDISVNPTDDVPLNSEDDQEDKPKWLSYKWPWRIEQLSKPKYIEPKYVYCPENEITEKFVWPPVDPEVNFRTDHLARPLVSTLKTIKFQYNGMLTPKWHQRMAKSIENSWKSIFNHYKFQIRKKQRRLQAKSKQEKAQKYDPKKQQKICEQRKERLTNLAKPKELKLPEPEPPIEPTTTLCDMYKHLDKLAQPHPYEEPKIKYIGYVTNAAKSYKATDTIIKLSKQQRIIQTLPPNELGVVNKRALKYKPTERILKLSTPLVKTAKKDDGQQEEERKISPAALKYKATEKILELSKPKEPEKEIVQNWLVKPSALKYKATKRIEELATPVRITPKYKKPD